MKLCSLRFFRPKFFEVDCGLAVDQRVATLASFDGLRAENKNPIFENSAAWKKRKKRKNYYVSSLYVQVATLAAEKA